MWSQGQFSLYHHFHSTGDDYRETVTDVTFRPDQSMTCAEIPIVDDTEEEVPENFRVGFGTTPVPGTRPGDRPITTVTIIDNDEPGTQI